MHNHAVRKSVIIPHNTTELRFISGAGYSFSFNTSNLLIVSSKWRKDGQIIADSGKKYRGTAMNTLTVLNAEETDSGVYSLTVTTQDRNTSTFRVNISIGEPIINAYSKDTII